MGAEGVTRRVWGRQRVGVEAQVSYVSYEEEEGLVNVRRKSYAPRPYNGVEARNFVTSMPLRRTDRDSAAVRHFGREMSLFYATGKTSLRKEERAVEGNRYVGIYMRC